MSWRDELRRASWRGLEFEVLSTERAVGREVAVHEFVQRDDVVGEDIRLATRTFSLDAYLIGDDYMTRRDAFEAALETAGVGILITPWKGRVSARLVSPAKVMESTKEGGMVRYSLEFIEETSTNGTVATFNTKAVSVAAAAALAGVAKVDLALRFGVANQPAFVIDRARAVIEKLSDRFDAVTAGLRGAGQTLSGYIAQGLALRAEVLDLVQKPIDLATSISAMVRGIRTIAATPADAYRALSSIMSFGEELKPVTGTTSARVAEAVNQTAVVDLVRRSAAAEVALAASEMEFVAYPEAVEVRDKLADRLDELALDAGDAGDDDAWRALVAVRSALVGDITARGGSLAQLYSYTPAMTMPALVLAHQLYPNSSDIEAMAEDICARNGIDHGGFVQGGIPLEVLADA